MLGLRVDEIVREYVAGASIFKPFDISVRAAAQTVADSLKKLRNAPISTAVDFYQTHGNNIKPENVPDVVRELINELRQDNRGDYHIDNMESRLNRFACSVASPIHQVLEHEITHWLQNLLKMEWKPEGVGAKGKKIHVQVENDKGERVSERTRNNYRDAVCELFAFAKKRGYVSRDLQTEASRTIRLEVDPGKNHIITPGECAKAACWQSEGDVRLFKKIKL
jgi:predicted SprT family Zn-dependent metalloprotease